MLVHSGEVSGSRLTLFSHTKLWANLIRPQFFVVLQGWVEAKRQDSGKERSLMNEPIQARRPPEVKPWVRRVVEAAGVFICGRGAAAGLSPRRLESRWLWLGNSRDVREGGEQNVRFLALKRLVFSTFPPTEAPHEVFLVRARPWEGCGKFFWRGHGGGRAARSFFGPGTAVGGRREVFVVRARPWERRTKFVWSGHGGGKTARSFFGPGTTVGRSHKVCAEVPFRGPGRGRCAPRPLLREACFSDGPRVVSSGILSNVLP